MLLVLRYPDHLRKKHEMWNLKKVFFPVANVQMLSYLASCQNSQIRLESLPNMNRFPQSKITKNLVRQLTCLLWKEWTGVKTLRRWPYKPGEEPANEVSSTLINLLSSEIYLAYTEYQSHCVLRPIETQSPGSWAAACSPPSGANCPKCLYLSLSM